MKRFNQGNQEDTKNQTNGQFGHDVSKERLELQKSHPLLFDEITRQESILQAKDKENRYSLCEAIDSTIRLGDKGKYGVGSYIQFKEKIKAWLVSSQDSDLKPGPEQKKILEKLKQRVQLDDSNFRTADRDWRTAAQGDLSEDQQFTGLAFEEICSIIDRTLKTNSIVIPKTKALSPPPRKVLPPKLPAAPIVRKQQSLTEAYARQDAREKLDKAATLNTRILPVKMDEVSRELAALFNSYLGDSKPYLLAPLFEAYDSKEGEFQDRRDSLDVLVQGLNKVNRKHLFNMLLNSRIKWQDRDRVERALMLANPKIMIDQLKKDYLNDNVTFKRFQPIINYLLIYQKEFFKNENFRGLELTFIGFVPLFHSDWTINATAAVIFF